MKRAHQSRPTQREVEKRINAYKTTFANPAPSLEQTNAPRSLRAVAIVFGAALVTFLVGAAIMWGVLL